MPVAVGAIIGGIADVVSTAAAAVGTGIEAIGAALAPEAVAGEAAAGTAAAEAGVGAAVGEGVVSLPEIVVPGTLGGVVGGEAAAAGTEAALAGGALAGGTEAALAGGGLAGGEALAAGGGLAGGVIGGAELASLLGGGTTAGLTGGALGATPAVEQLTGGALPGATPVPTTGVTNVAQTGGVPLGSSTAGGVPADVLSGTTGPLSALQPTTPFETLWQQSGAAGLPPSVDLSSVQPETVPALAETTNATAPVNPLATLPDTGAFAGAPGAVPGQTTESVANALNIGVGANAPPATSFADLLQSGTGAQELTAGTGIPTPEPLGIPETVAPSNLAAPPVTSDIAAIQGATNTGLPAGGSLTSAGGGISGAASNLFSGSTLRTLGLLAPLGALGVNLVRGPQPLPAAEQAAVANVGPGSPVSQVAQTNLTEGATGQLTPGQAAQVNKYVSDAKNQLYQLYARMGRDPTNDTDYIQGLAQIDQNAQIMTQQFVTAAITNGLAAQGVIDSTLQAAANIQVQNDQAFNNSIASATQAFGLTAALTAATSRA